MPGLDTIVRKGQASFEMLVMLGALLLFALPVFFTFFTSAHAFLSKASVSDAEALANQLAYEVDRIALSGPGAKARVIVYVPSGVESITMANGVLTVTFRSSNGVFVFKRVVLPKNHVVLRPSSGPHALWIRYAGVGTVEVVSAGESGGSVP